MNKEEIDFLREHLKDICAYKGLQQKLTYDVPLEILKRICKALDFLQQENEKLKQLEADLTTVYIKGYEDGKEKYNHYKLLYQKVKDRNDKAIEWVIDWTHDPNNWFETDAKPSELLEILKGESNE